MPSAILYAAPAMLTKSDIDMAEFGVSAQHGFLPEELPLRRLPDTYYSSWEDIMDELPTLLKAKTLRSHVDKLQVLLTLHLRSLREWQRAYQILSFLTHGYIWNSAEGGGPSERLPPAISVPFLEIASYLGLPPTATYSALNLWNFEAASPDTDLSRIENLKALHTFTGTEDEEWFYLISVAIEAHGAELIAVMVKAIAAVRSKNSHTVLAALVQFGYCVREMGTILRRMHERCSPEVFYQQIRPYLAGSKNMVAAGLSKGVFYDEGDGKGEWRQYSGGSNAQSSLIAFCDVTLGVEHFESKDSASRNKFFLEMRNYMPRSHRIFLERVESGPSIRDYAAASINVPELGEAYNFAVNELRKFRDIHIQIVARYIIRPAKLYSPTGEAGNNLAVASSTTPEKELSGTGGTALLPFLRQSREETENTALC